MATNNESCQNKQMSDPIDPEEKYPRWIEEPERWRYEAPVPECNWSSYGGIDFGPSTGGSIRHCEKRFKSKVIGIERLHSRVARLEKRGIAVVHGDALKLDADKAVRFVSMMNFLEHLRDLQAVEECLRRAARAATDFLFIRHPSFEGEELSQWLGYRQYWWNWTHHPAHVRIADYCAIFERLKLGPYTIQYVEPINHTSHESIISTGLPPNLNPGRAAQFPKPQNGAIPQTWWLRQEIFVMLRKIDPERWAQITARWKTKDRQV